jgi:DNA mismatch repair protein MutS
MVAVGGVIFLRKVIVGGCDSSYGIHVAKMAGVPDSVVDRAWEILEELERHGAAAPTPGSRPMPTRGGRPKAGAAGAGAKAGLQVGLFGGAAVPAVVENPLHRKAYEDLMAMDLNGLSPLQAMMKLHDLQQRLQGEKAAVGREPGG